MDGGWSETSEGPGHSTKRVARLYSEGKGRRYKVVEDAAEENTATKRRNEHAWLIDAEIVDGLIYAGYNGQYLHICAQKC